VHTEKLSAAEILYSLSSIPRYIRSSRQIQAVSGWKRRCLLPFSRQGLSVGYVVGSTGYRWASCFYIIQLWFHWWNFIQAQGFCCCWDWNDHLWRLLFSSHRLEEGLPYQRMTENSRERSDWFCSWSQTRWCRRNRLVWLVAHPSKRREVLSSILFGGGALWLGGFQPIFHFMVCSAAVIGSQQRLCFILWRQTAAKAKYLINYPRTSGRGTTRYILTDRM
jgi:hypothetical protein